MLIYRNSNILIRHFCVQLKKTMQNMKYSTQNVTKVESSTIPSQKTEINGYTINYVKVGTGPKNVLCCPGAFGTIWSDFKPQIEGLDRDKFTVIAWDPPGYGASRPPNREFSDDFYHKDADLALKLMTEKLGLKKFSVLGWSDGGISGIILASKYPESVDKLVVWGANTYIVQEEFEAYKAIQYCSQCEIGHVKFGTGERHLTVDQLIVLVIADLSKWSKRMKDPLIAIYTEEGLQKMCLDWYKTLSKMYKNGGDICKDSVKKITAPTLILHGDKDPVVAAEHPEYLFKNIKDAKLHRFPDGKHNIHLKYAEEFNKIITDFIL